MKETVYEIEKVGNFDVTVKETDETSERSHVFFLNGVNETILDSLQHFLDVSSWNDVQAILFRSGDLGKRLAVDIDVFIEEFTEQNEEVDDYDYDGYFLRGADGNVIGFDND